MVGTGTAAGAPAAGTTQGKTSTRAEPAAQGKTATPDEPAADGRAAPRGNTAAQVKTAAQLEMEELLQFLYLMPVAVVRLGAGGAVEMLNPRAVRLLQELGIDAGHSDGPTILDGLLPGLAARWHASAGSLGSVIPEQRCNPLHRPGAPLHLVLHMVRTDPRCTMLAIEDVTATVEQERELARQRRRMGLVLEHIHGYCVAMLDLAGLVTEWNPSIGALFGIEQAGSVGQPLLSWVARDVALVRPPGFEDIKTAVGRQGWCRLHVPWRKFGGQLLWGDCIVTPVVESDGAASSYVAVIRDVTDEHWRTQRLIDEAVTDPLTRLYNRRGLEQRVEALMNRPGGEPESQTWIMLDIDFFKRVNDTYGHDGGDAVLKALAKSLQETAREGDIIARVGGEEFVLLLPDATADAAVHLAERVRLAVAALVVPIGGREIRVTASLGVAEQNPGETWRTALERADLALYRAKHEGRDRVVLSNAAHAETAQTT